MSINIAICDDDTSEQAYLRRVVSGWAKNSGHDTNISVFDNAEAFLFAFHEDKSFDILLLDIQMKNMDGVELARRLRAEGGVMQIIFVTGYADHIAEGYDVSALHYLMKPVDERRLCEVLDKAYEKLKAAERFIIVETPEGQARLLHKDIAYAEAFAHTVIIYTTRGRYEAKVSIGELETMLSGGFFRCHRSYIVGLHHVESITKNDIVMDDGRTVPLSRRLYKEANMAFIAYYRGRRA